MRRRAAAFYAGFWLRFVAFLIDEILVSIVVVGADAAVGYILGINLGFRAGMSPRALFGRALPLKFAIGTITHWLYWAGLESSVYQATLGKMALGIKVTDIKGASISFVRATVRYLGKFVLLIILVIGSERHINFQGFGSRTDMICALIFFIGFSMAGWTARKQALHDLMAGTLVVKKQDFDEPS